MKFFYKENKILEDKINQYFKGLADFNEKYCEGKLSVILLGSLSRGEGTWIFQDGKYIMVSDIEFFTVYSQKSELLKKYEDYIQDYAKEVLSEHISDLFHVDNSFIYKEDVSKLEKKLLIYDAIKFGKCVVGNNIMDRFSDININNINLYDIKDILTHRIFSVLYYGIPLKEQKNNIQYKYSIAKNSLDIMTVILVQRGILESGFINRFEKIKDLDIDTDIKNYFSYCLSIKLGETSEYKYSIEDMEKIFISLIKQNKKTFKLHFNNIKTNLRHILKRKLGIVKRAIIYKHIVIGDHLERLINTFENSDKLSDKEKIDNLILNGYPKGEKI